MAKKKEKKEGIPIDPDAWMVTFSDLITLLLAFFVMLLTMKSMDAKTLKQTFSVFPGAIGLFGYGEKSIMGPTAFMPQRITHIDAEQLRKLLTTSTLKVRAAGEVVELKGAGGEEEDGNTGGLGGGEGAGAGDIGGELRSIDPALEGDRYSSLEEDYNDIIDFALGKKAEGEGGESEALDLKGITVMRTTRGIIARLPDKILFAKGSAKLLPQSLPLLEKIGNHIIAKNFQIAIEGHTDDVPIHTEKFPSNWELSTTRAVNVLRFLAARFKIPPDRISALGFADKKPLVPNVSEKQRAKNRRVVIVLHK